MFDHSHDLKFSVFVAFILQDLLNGDDFAGFADGGLKDDAEGAVSDDAGGAIADALLGGGRS